MNYLDRPIFEFVINWASPVEPRFSYDLRGLGLGQGEDAQEPTQRSMITGWNLEVLLSKDSEIQAFEDFFNTLGGSRQGFWLPVPFEEINVTGGVDASHFEIQSLGVEWDPDHPIYFTSPGQIPRISKVIDVEDVGSGRERITLEDGLTIDENWSAYRLYYARLADTEQSNVFSDGKRTTQIRVIELPLEYAIPNADSFPVWLYELSQDFRNGTVSTWRYTSFDLSLSDGVNDWNAYPIDHGALERSLELDRQECELELAYDPNHPLAQYLPVPPMFRVALRIYEGEFQSPGSVSDLKLRFTGEIDTVQPQGRKLEAQCIGLLQILDRKVPRFYIGPRCNVALYSDPCGVNPLDYRSTGTLGFTAYRNQVTLTHPDLAEIEEENWFAGGYLDTGSGANREVRGIRASSLPDEVNSITLTLGFPLTFAVKDQEAKAFAGCPGVASVCQGRFLNLINFRGHTSVPQSNLSIEAIPSQNSKGNKK